MANNCSEYPHLVALLRGPRHTAFCSDPPCTGHSKKISPVDQRAHRATTLMGNLREHHL